MEERVEDAEVKIAFLEHHLAELDGLVRALHDQVARLRDEVEALRQERPADAPRRTLEEEVPPHHDRY